MGWGFDFLDMQMTVAGVLCVCEWDEAVIPWSERSERVDGARHLLLGTQPKQSI